MNKLKFKLKNNKVILYIYVKFFVRFSKRHRDSGIYKTHYPIQAEKRHYYNEFGEKLNLKKPKNLNEKICFLKLFTYSDNAKVIQCTDKLRVREYVEQKELRFLLNDLIAVYRNVLEIDWEVLPNKFVLKHNASSGKNFICENKEKYDKEEILDKVSSWFDSDFGIWSMEPHYAKIKPCIICERYIESNSFLPYDYKISCFNGKAMFIGVYTDRDKIINHIFVDKEYNFLNIDTENHVESDLPPKPDNFHKMIKYAECLSEDFPLCRVDFYDDNGRVIFGEMTFTPAAGHYTTINNDALQYFGEKLVLCDVK
ncbi:MAG: ATP-grasp fold amidoligase family protein [Bacillota bacterium]